MGSLVSKKPSRNSPNLEERMRAYDLQINQHLRELATRPPVRRESTGREVAKSSAVGGIVTNSWNTPPKPNFNYERVSKEGYGGNEIVYACIEELATSAAEPVIRAYNAGKVVDNHPILELLEHPNPFLNGYDFIASMIMFRSLAGNSYTEIVFNNRGDRPVELWPLRPDRITIIPHPTRTIQAYRFEIGTDYYDYTPEEIGHYKTRNPLNQYYGLAPISVLFSRIDTDNIGREFTKSFYYNKGVPSTLLAFKGLLDDQEREIIRRNFNRDYSGPSGWHGTMVTENNELSVHQLGMPMGDQGLAFPELDEINEARLAMVFGVPLTLINARLSMTNSAYASRVADREIFWNETLVPIYKELEASINSWLTPHFDIDYIKFDLSTVHAFGDETDVLHARWRNNFTQSLAAWRESRREIGLNDDPEDDDILIVPTNMYPIKFSDFKNGKFTHITQRDHALKIAQAGANRISNPNNGDRRNENGNDSRPFTVNRNGSSSS